MTRHGTRVEHEVAALIGRLPARGFTALAWLVGLVTLLATAPGLGR